MVRHFEHNGVRAESGVAAAIIECCGSDMFTLANEVDKLSFYARSCGRDTVTLSDVPLVVSPNEEYDAFALGEAVADKRFERALSILSLMKARRIDPLIILGELSKTLSDMLGVKLLLEAGFPFLEKLVFIGGHSLFNGSSLWQLSALEKLLCLGIRRLRRRSYR